MTACRCGTASHAQSRNGDVVQNSLLPVPPVSRTLPVCSCDTIVKTPAASPAITGRWSRPSAPPAGYVRDKTPKQPNHMEDFFNCVRSRGTPKCGVDEAFVEIATSLMSIESYMKRRVVRWDPVKEEIV